MCKKSLFALILVLPLLAACGGNGRKDGAPSQDRHVPELLATVPSDALAVLCFDQLEKGLPLYDSTSVLHQLDLSAFKHARMALSLCFNGSLVPVLAVDTGRADADSTAALRDLTAQAATLRLRTEYVRPDLENKRDGFLLITPSEAQLAAVRRHLSEHTGIQDAPGFQEALEQAESGEFIIFRNSGAERLIPKGWLGDAFPRRDLTAFLRNVADWTILRPASGGFDVVFSRGASDAFYANILASLPAGDSRLAAVLPPETSLALTESVTLPEMRLAMERYQDASVRITPYRRTLEALKKASGKDPLKWEQELKVQEIALVHFPGGVVSLIRPGKSIEDSEPAENPWRGFLPALYGSAFALPDDSVTASFGGWYIYGSDAAVRAFIEAERPEGAGIKLPARGCRVLVYEPQKTLAWGKKGIKLQWDSNR